MKYCNICDMKLDSDVKFCPQCGNSVIVLQEQNSNLNNSKKSFFNRKKIIITILIVAGIGAIVAVSISLWNYFSLKDKSSASKSKAIIDINNNTYNENLGNFPGNICSGAYSVYGNNNYFVAFEDGIYKFDNIDSQELKCEDGEKLQDGSFSSLNYHDEKLFVIDKKNNSVDEINIDDGSDQNKKEILKASDGSKYSCLEYVDGKLFVLSNKDNKYSLCEINIESKKTEKFSQEFSSSNCWLNISNTTINLCAVNASSWTYYKTSIFTDKNAGFSTVCSGSGNVNCIAFVDDKIYCSVGDGKSSKIVITDSSGNRQEISPQDKIVKLLSVDKSVFAQTASNKLLWFNSDTNMTHDIENDILDNKSANAINFNNGKLFVIDKKEKSLAIDKNSLT